MGAQQSKDELLYQQVNYGNVEGIRALRRDGAGLEWIDKEGKTPLILACMRPELLHVAKLLIELGANVNAYRPGCHAGTPLHHAAKRGLDQTVNLLLSHGANPFVMNDDCETPLALARVKGHCNTVRAIESRICLFSGWLRELHGPSILEALVPQWLSKKIWAVVLPCDFRNPMKPQKFDLAIYPDLKVAQPRAVLQLWKVHIEEPNFNQPDPALIIADKAAKTRYRFLAANEGDKQQLQWFYNGCRGISQVNNYTVAASVGMPVPNRPHDTNAPATSTPAGAAPPSEDIELEMAINASIQSAIAEGLAPFPNGEPSTGTINTSGWETTSENTTHNGWGRPDGPPPSKVSTNGWSCEPTVSPQNGWSGVRPSSSAPSGVRPSSSSPQLHTSQIEAPTVVPSAQEAPPSVSAPSAPPAVVEDAFYDGPIQYPSIDSSPVNLTAPTIESKSTGVTTNKEESSSALSSCVICLDAPVEGACIPCGHMAGCMSCLSEIQGKKWGCPVCRAKIDQVIRLYAV